MAEPITQVLGTVAIKHMGEYDSSENYEKLNVVTYQGSSYCAKTNTRGNAPTDTTYWELMASKGDTGAAGEPGYTPVKGTDYYTDADKAELEVNLANDVTAEVTTQIGTITEATPTVVSSASGMTDTSKIYVLSTNGHWYWNNGTDWVDGGVYQATAVADNSVSYNSLTQNLKNTNYREIHAEDMIWYDKQGIYNGTLTNDSSCILSQPFKMSKGSSITIANTLKCRITQWNLSKTYITNTGTYAVQTQPWVADRDCIVRISVASADAETPATLSDITNENISVTGLVALTSGDEIVRNLEFDRVPDTYVIISKPIYCGKGTKISLVDFGFTNSAATATGVMLNLGISPSNEYSTPSSATMNGEYTTTKDGFVKIKVRIQKLNASGSLEITDDMLPKMKNNIIIEQTQYNSISSTPNCYVSSNNTIKIVRNYQTTGANLIRINGLVVRNNSKVIADLSISDIETQLSSYIVTYNDENYIKVPAYNGLIYDLRAETLKIMQLNQVDRPYVTDDVLYLALNGYAFFFDGIILEQWARQQLTALQTKVDNNIVTIFNSGTVADSYDWKTKAKSFTTLFKSINSTNIESFLFFTDQHLMGLNDTFDEDTMKTYINKLQRMYNSTPTSFIVSGGDWLQAQDTQENACFKLGYIDGFMNSMFKDYYPINGNHDTNYQGVINPGEVWTGELNLNTETNLQFRKYGRMYYKFAGNKSMNYVLDTQLEIYDSMTAYKWAQVDWLANELLADNPTHATVMMHIVWRILNPVTVCLLADNITKLINAYNTRTSITLNNIIYDFSNATGHVDYVLSGHTHVDMNDTLNGVLCVATTQFKAGSVPTYDLIINDYDNHKLRMIRVGSGSDRTFDI